MTSQQGEQKGCIKEDDVTAGGGVHKGHNCAVGSTGLVLLDLSSSLPDPPTPASPTASYVRHVSCFIDSKTHIFKV